MLIAFRNINIAMVAEMIIVIKTIELLEVLIAKIAMVCKDGDNGNSGYRGHRQCGGGSNDDDSCMIKIAMVVGVMVMAMLAIVVKGGSH